MGLTLMFATTVMILPCREAFLSLVPQMKAWWKESVQNADKLGYVSSETKTLMSDPASFRLNSYSSLAGEHFETEMSAEGDEENTFEDENAVPGRNPFVHFITTVFIAAYAFYAAVSVPGVAIVWSVVGSSLGMIIGFIIPCACYFKIRGKKGLWRPTNLGALALLIFSVVIALVCTIQTIMAPIKE
jgi:amino acid permease